MKGRRSRSPARRRRSPCSRGSWGGQRSCRLCRRSGVVGMCGCGSLLYGVLQVIMAGGVTCLSLQNCGIPQEELAKLLRHLEVRKRRLVNVLPFLEFITWCLLKEDSKVRGPHPPFTSLRLYPWRHRRIHIHKDLSAKRKTELLDPPTVGIITFLSKQVQLAVYWLFYRFA